MNHPINITFDIGIQLISINPHQNEQDYLESKFKVRPQCLLHHLAAKKLGGTERESIENIHIKYYQHIIMIYSNRVQYFPQDIQETYVHSPLSLLCN